MPNDIELQRELTALLELELNEFKPSDQLILAALRRSPSLRSRRHRSLVGALVVTAAVAAGLFAVLSDGAPARLAHDAHAASAQTRSGTRIGPHSEISPRGSSRPIQQTAAVHVLGHNLKVLPGYRLVSMTESSCQAWLAAYGTIDGFSSVAPLDESVAQHVAGFDAVIEARGDVQACIYMTISAPYSSPTSPTITATTPFVGAAADQSPMTIDGYYAEAVPAELTYSKSLTSGPTLEMTGTTLYVRVVTLDGQFRLFTALGWDVSQADLVQLTTRALATG